MMLRATKVFLHSLAIIPVLAILMVMTAAPVVAGEEEPTMAIEPSSGPVGTMIYVKMTGFLGEGQVAISFKDKGNIVQTVNPDEWGDCTASFTVGTYPAGRYRVWAKYGANELCAYFTLEPAIELNKPSGYAGDNVVVAGTGFAVGKPVTVYFDDASVATGKTGENGTFTNILLTIPESGKGSHTVKVEDSQANYATSGIIIRQKMSIVPTSGTVGSEVSIGGTGFEADGNIVIYFDDKDVTGTCTDENGSFRTTFRVPVRNNGSYKIKVSDGTNNYYEDFTVTAGIMLTPTTGGIGTYLTVQGTGFRVGLPVTITYDGDEADSAIVDVGGAFSVTFGIPVSCAGGHTVTTTAGANSIGATFTVESTPPPTPKLLLPADATETAEAVYFDWENVSDPSGVSYALVVASDANLSDVLFTKEGLTDSEYTLSEEEKLPPSRETPYYWRVRAIDRASNMGEWSTIDSFYVAAPPPPLPIPAPITVPPPVPALLMPETGSKIEAPIYFDWEDISNPSGVTYTLVIASDADLSDVLLTKEELTNSEYTLSKEERLPTSKEAPYYWRVRAVDGASNVGEWSAPESFYVGFSFFSAMPSWTKYSLIGLGLVLLCFLCFWLGIRSKNTMKRRLC